MSFRTTRFASGVVGLALAPVMILVAHARPAMGQLPTAWEEIRDADGIRVYRGASMDRGRSQAGVFAFRGETLLPADIETVRGILADASTAHEWMPQITRKEVIAQVSPTERIEYSHFDSPWPVQDRYIVARAIEMRTKSGGYWFKVKSTDGREHHEPAMVLALIYDSTLSLEPTPDNMTRMWIEVLTDPRGLIPKWVVNWVQPRWPYEFLSALRDRCRMHQSPSQSALAH